MNRPSYKLRMKKQIRMNHEKEFEIYRRRAIDAETILRVLHIGDIENAKKRTAKLLETLAAETCERCNRPIPIVARTQNIECRCDGTFQFTD